MTESFVFTGIGFETGKYAILNADIEQYINSGYLEGFDAKRIENTEDYKLYRQKIPTKLQWLLTDISWDSGKI
jgi:hypothetical protein